MSERDFRHDSGALYMRVKLAESWEDFFWWRQAVIADMAKSGSGEASAARSFLVRTDIFWHGGGSYHRGGRSGVCSAPGAHLANLTCRRPEVTFWLIGRKNNPKAGTMRLQMVANMRRYGPVPAAERSCAAGDQQRLPCPKSEVGAMAPWGAEVKTDSWVSWLLRVFRWE